MNTIQAPSHPWGEGKGGAASPVPSLTSSRLAADFTRLSVDHYAARPMSGARRHLSRGRPCVAASAGMRGTNSPAEGHSSGRFSAPVSPALLAAPAMAGPARVLLPLSQPLPKGVRPGCLKVPRESERYSAGRNRSGPSYCQDGRRLGRERPGSQRADSPGAQRTVNAGASRPMRAGRLGG